MNILIFFAFFIACVYSNDVSLNPGIRLGVKKEIITAFIDLDLE